MTTTTPSADINVVKLILPVEEGLHHRLHGIVGLGADSVVAATGEEEDSCYPARHPPIETTSTTESAAVPPRGGDSITTLVGKDEELIAKEHDELLTPEHVLTHEQAVGTNDEEQRFTRPDDALLSQSEALLLVQVVQERVDQQQAAHDHFYCPPLPAPIETTATSPSNAEDNPVRSNEEDESIIGLQTDDHLTPEDLLDQVLRGRREGKVDAAAGRDDTVDYGSILDNDGCHHCTSTTSKHDPDGDKDMHALVDDLEANLAALPPPMRRQAPHSCPGAFGLGHCAGGTAAQFSAARRRGDHCDDEGTADTYDDDDNNNDNSHNVPPIRAILVVDDRSVADPAFSIYTAEVVKKHIIHRKRWNLAAVALCAMCMITIIAVSVAVTVVFADLDEHSQDHSSDRHEGKEHRGSSRRGSKGDSMNDIDRFYTHHALVFGTSAQPCPHIQGDAKLNVVVSCHDGDITLETMSNSKMVCHSLDEHLLMCEVPMSSETIEYLLFDCFNINSPSSTDLVTVVDLSVPSLSSCLFSEGEPIVVAATTTATTTAVTTTTATELAFARLLRFCDDPWEHLYSSAGTECPNSERVELPYPFTGACAQDCPIDGCNVQAHDVGGDRSCRPSYQGQDSEQVQLALESIRSEIVLSLFHSSAR